MSKEILYISIVTLVLLFRPDTVQAEESAVRTIKMRSGRQASINLQESDKALKKVIFYAKSPGTSTQKFTISLGTDSRITAKIYSRAVRAKGELEAASVVASGWQTLAFQQNGKRGKSLSFGNPSALRSLAVTEDDPVDPNCGCMKESEIADLIAAFAAAGYPRSREEVCAMMKGGNSCGSNGETDTGTGGNTDTNTGGGTGDNTGTGGDTGGNTGNNDWRFMQNADATTILEKNTCTNKYAYYAKVEVDLSAIPESHFKEGITINATLKFENYNGDRAATLKPASDGKWSPQPILLISQINQWGVSQEVRLVYWKGAKISRTSKLTTGENKNIFNGPTYHYMHLRTMGPYLRGGQAVVEVAVPSSSLAYSHCLKLSRTRQCFGGYRR